MASRVDFIEYVCEQLRGAGDITYKKMFGEYMIYLNGKPVVIVCDNTPFVKKLDCIKDDMVNAKVGVPYKGAKEHYVLDVDDSVFCQEIIKKIESEIK